MKIISKIKELIFGKVKTFQIETSDKSYLVGGRKFIIQGNDTIVYDGFIKVAQIRNILSVVML